MEKTVDPVAEEMPYQIVRSGQCLSVTFSDEQDMDELGYKILNGISGTNLLCGWTLWSRYTISVFCCMTMSAFGRRMSC